ncbi:MAG: hypothetical protein HKN24_08195 [Acidimicrobiales bacterium]|nr:hypothetical protein [Acidimicrobiales bacterium]
MAKFLGSLCALVAALSLVAVSYIWAVAALTEDDFADDVAANVIEDPEARAEIADEIVDWFAEQPGREAALQTAFGAEWEEPARRAAELAVQTPEFAAAYQGAFDEVRSAEPGEAVALTVDLGPAVAAITSDLDSATAVAIDRLPADFFVLTDEFNSEDWNQIREFRRDTDRVAAVGLIAGLACAVLALALFRSPMPLAFIGSVGIGFAVLVALLLQSVRADVVADAEGAIERIAVDSAIGSILGSTLRLGLVSAALIALALAVRKLLNTLQGRSGPKPLPGGSDTDWAETRAEAGFPQIIS